MINKIGFNRINSKDFRKFNQLLMIIFFIFLSTNIYAAGVFTEQGTISRIQFGTNGDFVLYHTSNTHPNPGNCISTTYYRVPFTLPYYNALYAMLLSAYTTQQPISLYVDGCVSNVTRVTTARMIKS